MEILKELALVLNRYCVKNINVITPQQTGEGDLVDTFYNLLQDEPDLSKEEFAQRLYGEDSSEKDNRFRKLKQRLTRRMANTLFFIDPKDNQFNELQSAYYVAYREYALARILQGRNAIEASRHYLRKVFVAARKFEFSELLLLTADALRAQHAYQVSDQDKYVHYRQEYFRARLLFNMERDVVMAYEEVVFHYGVSPEARKETIERIQVKLAEIHADYPQLEHTYRSIINYYGLRTLLDQLRGDAKSLIAAVDEGLAILEQKPYPADIPQSFLYLTKVVVHLVERDFAGGTATLTAAYPLLTPGFANWFKFKELEFLLAMHTGHYQEAFATYRSVANFKTVNALPKTSQDRWRLNRAYLYYLEATGRLEIDPAEDPWGPFRLTKFLNSVPEFSQDKKGMNIPILILQIAFGIALKRYSLSVDRIEAIEKYRSRHISRDENYRANLFIKILLQFPIMAFHRNGVKRKTEAYLKQLNDNPIDLAKQSFDFEILPYETVYATALESLELKFHKETAGNKKAKV